ncbi:MAG: polysaccharide biosynthesis tyrosine autokinase [Verrucomicrobiales bacterium]|nr:polysaccharide biosynthesis tyrosine autokinase [Verrucomicrobiales bacterium]
MSHPQYYNEAPSEYPDPQGHKLQDYFRWFVKRFWIFLLTLIFGYLLGLYVYSSTPPSYQSSATIEILRVKKDAADVDEEEKIRMSGAAEMLSASEKLQLSSYYVETAKGHLFSDRKDIIPETFKFPWQEEEQYSSSELTPEIVGSLLQSWISVGWRPDTTLLDIVAVHSDPAIARDALVGLLSTYEQATENKVAGSSEYALDYILESSSEVKERILELDKALRLYNRCLELSEEVRAAERQIAEMEKRYLPRWPALVEAKELQTILKKRFTEELNQVIRLSEDEKQFWNENQTVLGDIPAEEKVAAQIQLVSTRSSVITRELEAEQQIYDNLITKLKEGNVSIGFASKQFDIVQPPSLPGRPFAPIKSKVLITYTAGGAAIGIGIILLLGFMDPTVRTVAELESLTGLSAVGAMPFSKEVARDKALVMLSAPESQPAEAIRTLRAGLTFLGNSSERGSFLITSAIPGEGKSWITANLALSFATQGDRTLLIDADMRRPVQPQIFGYDKASKGLSDHLSLGTPIKELLVRTEASENLYLLPAGSRSANPSELLAGKALGPLIEKLNEFFDRIIIDSAPLVPVSDSLPLAKQAQSIVLVSRIGKTPKGAIKRAVRILSENQTEPVGVVANGLPKTRTKGSYGYYYSYSGGGNYSDYAQNGS